MRNIIRYIILTAQRDSLFLGLAISIVFACYMAFFLGGTALVEQQEMSLVYAAGVSRIVLVVGLIVFIAFHVRRSFENREIDLMLVRPISRSKFIISYWIGFSIIALFLVIFTSAAVYGFSSFMYPDVKVNNFEGYATWSASLFLEVLIVVALALASALILRSTVIAVLFCLGFYVLSRMAGFILLIATKPGAGGMVDFSFLSISKLMPRLDFFSKTEWLIYGVLDKQDVYLFLIQAVIYSGLLLSVAVVDFKRKEF